MRENKDNKSSEIMSKQAEEVGWLRVRHVVGVLYLKEKGEMWTWKQEWNVIWLLCDCVPQFYRSCCEWLKSLGLVCDSFAY